MYHLLQQRVYENKLKHNFNVLKVNKEITLMTEEFGELCDACITENHPEIIDAIGDIMIYCLGLSAMFKTNPDEIINKDVEQPKNKGSILDYLPYVGKELGLFAKAYNKSNKQTVDEIDRREEFIQRIGNIMGYCSEMFSFIHVDEMDVLENIISNNTTRTHHGKI
jgi:NTP pyrophosphatase (non-canonical NTP hydrolase)